MKGVLMFCWYCVKTERNIQFGLACFILLPYIWLLIDIFAFCMAILFIEQKIKINEKVFLSFNKILQIDSHLPSELFFLAASTLEESFVQFLEDEKWRKSVASKFFCYICFCIIFFIQAIDFQLLKKLKQVYYRLTLNLTF